jgi:hypothetical protein
MYLAYVKLNINISEARLSEAVFIVVCNPSVN